MKPLLPSRPLCSAFTLIELLTVVSIIGLLTALATGVIARGKLGAKRAQCLSHLHQVGLGLQNSDPDGYGRYPWQASQSEAVSDVYDHWLSLSNSLDSAKVLHCPADNRFQAPILFADLTAADISYTLCLKTHATSPEILLATDAFLSEDFITVPVVDEVYWETKRAKSHGANSGNGLFADGSARVLSNNALHQALLLSLRGEQRGYIEFLKPGMSAF
jgi:prepilin-type N-terminal cleavage/methylation domain-containing protein/prepilin-type processing-associated H-X9-DG protein